MSQKNAKGDGKSVLGSLPSTRPTRMARRRDGEPAAEAKPREAPKRRAAAKARPAGASAKATTSARADEKRATATSKPRAVRSGSPSLKQPKGTPQRPKEPAGPPKGTELVTTAVQAAGELAQIGLTVGSQVVKRAVKRLPKP